MDDGCLVRENYEIGDMDTDIVRSYMEAHNPVSPQMEGRIQINNTCTRTAKPVSCNTPPSEEASASGGTKPELTIPILSLVSLFLENLFS